MKPSCEMLNVFRWSQETTSNYQVSVSHTHMLIFFITHCNGFGLEVLNDAISCDSKLTLTSITLLSRS